MEEKKKGRKEIELMGTISNQGKKIEKVRKERNKTIANGEARKGKKLKKKERIKTDRNKNQ